jgi:hypothetical protein
VQDHHSGEEEGDAEKAEADEGFSLLNPEEKKYMEGWNEIMYSSLRRRNAVIGDEDAHFLPDPSMLPRDVITKVMTALMNNDEPCPDHGCAVVIRFSSDSNPVGEMEAAQLGRYFRSSDLRMMLLDANHFEFLDDLVTESNVNGEFALQVWWCPAPLRPPHLFFTFSHQACSHSSHKCALVTTSAPH